MSGKPNQGSVDLKRCVCHIKMNENYTWKFLKTCKNYGILLLRKSVNLVETTDGIQLTYVGLVVYLI